MGPEGFSEIRKLIIDRIVRVLADEYNETIPEPLPKNLTGYFAFKDDPYLDELHRALLRMEEGTFGSCLLCRDDIDVPTLRAVPTAHFCGNCSEKVQKLAIAEHGRINPFLAK